MKKLYLVLISLILLTSVGCGSNAVSSEGSADYKEPKSPSLTSSGTEPGIPSGLYYENKLTNEKLLIDDWKYMGFGNEMPEWVIPALEDNVSKVKKTVPELENAQIIILQTEGYNHDQAENALDELAKPEGFEKYDSFWVRAYPDNKKNMGRTVPKRYIAVAVYYKLIES